MIGKIDQLRAKIGLYRAAFSKRPGHREDVDGQGHATVMVHTFVGDEAAIESQAALIEEARRERELCRAHLARSLGAPADASFDHLLPLLPEDYRPLIRALVEENNELLTRVRARSRQNHLLLSRTVELMQRLMGSLFAAKGGGTYSGDGALLGSRAPARRMYEAVG